MTTGGSSGASDTGGTVGAPGGSEASGGVTAAGGAASTGGAEAAGGADAMGGAVATGGAAGTAGSASAGAAGAGACAGNLLQNPGFELADKKGVPTGWDRLSPQSSTDGTFTVVTTAALEGTSSLYVDTTNLKKPPADYVLVVATTAAYDVSATSTLYLSAAARVDDQLAPIWVAVLYFDSGGGMLGVFASGDPLAVDHLEFTHSASFVSQGPLVSSVPRLAATARVGIVAGQGVTAYVDSVCLTR
jgi:hypothetical protein